jgi:hypothetical protein
LSCECRKSIEESLVAIRSRVIGERNKTLRHLDVFKESLRNGFYQLIAKHLFKAGTYFASLDNDFTRNPHPQQIINSLKRRLNNRDKRLLDFVERNRVIIGSQVDIVDVKELLQGILKQKEKAKGLLEANGERELQEAERILDRLEKLEHYFSAWKVGMSEKTDVLKIVDMHD